MKPLLPFAIVVMTLTPYPAMANPIERACNQSDRSAATRSLCSCIGDVADDTLSRSEMRQGARFFSDPDRAQEVRTSDRPADERFWDNWREFGAAAQRRCG